MQANTDASGRGKASRQSNKGRDGFSAEQVSNPSLDAVTATTYPFTTSAGVALEDMSSGTTQLVAANVDDTASAVTNIGFDFWYDGVRFTQFSCNANGLCRLGSTAVTAEFDNADATFGFNTTTNAPKIAPYFDDLWVGTNGKVHFKVVGSAPNRKLVVEWLNEQIPLVGTGVAGAGTFQMWLFETSGVIEFVYGNGIAVNSANGGYSIGLQSGAATNFASVTSSTSSVSYAAANNTQTNAIAAGTAYIFTPNVPAAPTTLTFAPVTGASVQLNWADNSSNEVGFVIYRSTDGVNYNFITQTAANATSFNDSGLIPGTTYFYRVYAVTEGALSGVLSGSQATSPAGVVTSTAAGGNWSAPGTWVGGVVPTAADNVTIVDGATVTIDIAATALNLTVGQGTSGILQYEPTTARTLTVGQAVTIATGGVFQSAATGTVTTHVLSVGSDLTNNGTLDFSTNANTAAASITFTGATNNTFSGTGATTDIRAITINKGTSNANVLELLPTNFTVRGVATDVAGFLTLTNGTFKISGTFAVTNRVFTTATYVIPATAGIWLNNPNFVVAGTASSTTTNCNGLFRLTQGTYNVGVGAADGIGGAAGAVFIIEGGTLNASGRFGPQSAVSYTQTAGTVNVAVVGNSRSLFGSFELFSSGSFFTMSGGTINVINRNTGTTQVDYDVLSGTANTNVTGGLLVIGATGAPAATTYHVQGTTPNLTINPGMTMVVTTNASSTFPLFMRGTTVLNNGAITSAATGSPRFDFGGNGPMTYTGGTFGTAATPFAGVGISANSTFLTTLNSPIVCNRVNLFQGGFINSNQITLGNLGASTTVVQIGSTGLTTPGGSFDVSPNHQQGSGGEIVIYAFETTPRTTGVEVNPTRILTSMSVDNSNNLTIAGGDISLSSAAAALTMTSGRIITGVNTLALLSGTATVTRTSGYVDGNFRKNYAAAASKVFEVGTANGYSPVTVNATAGTFPTDFTAKAVQGPQPAVNPATSIQRYWTLNGTGITADLTFQYLAADVMGTEANYRVIRVIGGTSVSFPTSTVNTGTHVATLTGVSTFSDWTVGETSSPTAAPATIRGQITNPDGSPLGGVIVNLGGSQSARTITDGNGMYRFDNVESGKLYLVRPDRANYSFSPSERAFSLNADKTDAVFTATPASIPTGNPLDADMYFVRQQYLDFLGREPDHLGLLYWTSELDKCGTDAPCLNQRRVDISAAFFMEAELQQTGSYVYRLYKGALGRRLSYEEYSADRQKVVGGDDLDASKKAFAGEFVKRHEFTEKYSQATGAESFVDSLLASLQQTSGADLSNQRSALIESYNGGANMNESRALALTKAIDVTAFKDAEYNPSFVLMEYFGYLKRNPETEGFQFWLNVLDNKEPRNYRGMVCSFITSAEYQLRFSPVTTHSNRECR
ncbi:MAG TPA: fibronectin type III domain-containing protein [Pyrinomonadaceae bacterium]|jgi:hypothetical protein|nr:fibronectin type III domain-containing protein [Pyrinomonadaceae bacterium]